MLRRVDDALPFMSNIPLPASTLITTDPMTKRPEPQTYEVQLFDESCSVLMSKQAGEVSGDAVAWQLDGVVNGKEAIAVLADGNRVFEMGVEFWQKRVRQR